jgi:hypothetical protein
MIPTEKPAPPAKGNRLLTDLTTSTSDSIGPHRLPQEAHADLGLRDDDNTPDLRVDS